ncbi:MAG: phosphoglycerate dehydrogenase [Gammaproteobacteria bacterium]|nr:phosphoglycerate dehydrogenase [Gammaproteobacteria bacterium]MCZ6716960.1 phosphoglycerate dehydrogenase [Gammaproteobacteria bacterium]MCZ6826134.1 phosphoglycerate dehydrogenase [Gammaproteobacteria bacterium]MCZ6911278.1 phosphoglycerate dehydrogenase [Pseudomonadota bacterium]
MSAKNRFKILTLNNVSLAGLKRFPRRRYEVASDMSHPDAIMLRSHNMHDMEIPETLLAVARAGAGVNNIPVERCSAAGVPVFNAPGANANAVKELVLTAIFLAARNICQAADHVKNLQLEGEELDAAVEAGKKQFVGFEIPGKILGVVGLGAIGVEVANAALNLGMKVVGFDPQITVRRAWQMSSGVEQASSLDDLFSRADVITTHVPITDGTRCLVNGARLGLMRDGAVLLNFARAPIVDEDAVASALESGKLHAFVTDFPSAALKNHPRVTALPHLGASTYEAEENCAIMVADNLRDFLENGNIRHSVNFPEAIMPRNGGQRLVVVNANVPNMVGQISTALAEANLNIADLLNKSRDDLAYTVVDIDGKADAVTLGKIGGIDGVLSVRAIAD